jgi:hypothetical protein
MVSRVGPAGFALIVSLGLTFAPNETFGRSGYGRLFPVSSGFRPSAVRPPMQASPPNLRSLLHLHQFGFGIPPNGPDGSFAYDHGPSDHIDPYDQPASADPELVTGAIPDGVDTVAIDSTGCRSQTVTVPSDDGRERPINIVRC